MQTHRPFQQSIETINRLVSETPDSGTALNLHIKTWFNTEPEAKALAEMEAAQATKDGRAILKTFADLTGRQYHVCLGALEVAGRSLDECGEELIKLAMKACIDRAHRNENEAYELRKRVREVSEPKPLS